jgi:hypothetical protein
MDYRADSQDGYDAAELAAYEAELNGYGEDGDYADYDEYVDYYDDSMDGDFDSAMRDAGWGTDEDYGYYGDEDY